MRPRLKVVFSWVLAAIGSFVGLCALANFGMWWAPLGDHDPGWLLRWLTLSALAYLEAVFWSAPLLRRETLGVQTAEKSSHQRPAGPYNYKEQLAKARRTL